MRKYLLSVLILLSVVGFLPEQALAAWVAEDTFDSYANASALTGSGGTSFTGAWGIHRSVNTWTNENSTVFQGTIAVQNSNGGGRDRQLTSDISGSADVVYVSMRRTSASAGAIYFTLTPTTWNPPTTFDTRVTIALNSAGNIVADGTTVKSGYSANTWYTLRITLNVSGSTYKVAWSSAAFGASPGWSADTAAINMTSAGNIRFVDFEADSSAATGFIDNISGTSPFAEPGPPAFIVSSYWW